MRAIKPNLKSYGTNAGLIVALFAVLMLVFELGIGGLNQFHRGRLVEIFVFIILAVSLNLTAGFLGQLVLGHAAFMAVGAYTSALISAHFGISGTAGFVLVLIAGGLAAAVSGLIIGIPALRLRGDYVAIATLAFGIIVESVLINLRSITNGADGLPVRSLTTFGNSFFIMAIVVAALVLLTRSRHGRAMIAIREDEIAAEASGINTVYYKILGFAVSAFFAGVGGGLFAHNTGFIVPEAFAFEQSVELLVIVVLGGMGSFTGAIVATVVIRGLREFLHAIGDYRMLAYATLLVAMMIFRPKGLMGTYEFSVENIKNKIFGRRT